LANIIHPTNAGRLRNNLRSASSSDYSMPRLRTKFGESAFSHAGPAAWNALPEDIRANQDRAIFRKQLKTHIFTLAFNVHLLLGFILILYRPSVCDSVMHLCPFCNRRTINLLDDDDDDDDDSHYHGSYRSSDAEV